MWPSVVFVLGIDTLLASEWQRLDDIVALLEPFAMQTDILQTDTQSLSSIVCHRV
jgi:hypothetical protein